MENPHVVLIDLPSSILSEIYLIAAEENSTTSEVILDLLQCGVSHAIEERLQSKKRSLDSENDD